MYNAQNTEKKWQAAWEEAHVFQFDLKKAPDPFYCLVMFPYPSGAQLHVGHWYQYSIPDSYVRFLRMKGKEVFHPMGFDAFGLPAENFAIKSGIPPATSTQENVTNMIQQFKRMGVTFDWSKSLNTSSPEYYRWTQWLFLEMYKHGLAYKKEAHVNYCSSCQTVLANEQCQDGHCERCETQVIQKPLPQWFFRITDFAGRLLDGLEHLDWPEKTKLMQRNWIGKSEGAVIEFNIKNESSNITVFTTRPDTLFGATYIVLAPEHPMVETITPKGHIGAVHAYQENVRKKTDLERTDLNKVKTGVWTGAYAINPATEEEIPVWIADYVLSSYGTGAVMAVPAHDERDWEFAKTYDLPVKEVVAPPPRGEGTGEGVENSLAAFTTDGTCINSSFLNGLKTSEAKKKIVAWLEDKEIGRHQVQYRLRDWLVSRQRYWGAPIPVVYDPDGNPHPIPEKHLPWLLPTDVEFKPTGESPLKHSKEFRERTEKIFGKGWVPEFDTMDTFVCSSFYYLRFLMEGDLKKFIDPHLEKKWMPVDLYIGGPEHACMHLIYARFIMMALNDFGYVSSEEPFKKLIHQGLITNKGAKMSKSRGNVVSPDTFVERYGSDVFRMYLMFMGPFTDGGDWSDTGIKGIERFVQRVWRLFEKGIKKNNEGKDIERLLHKTVKKVTEDIENFRFNTAIAALMEFLNAVEKRGMDEETAKIFVLLLSPMAPHLAEELWEKISLPPRLPAVALAKVGGHLPHRGRIKEGGREFIVNQCWPTFDPKFLLSDTMTIVVQINGKVRANIDVNRESTQEHIVQLAKDHPHVQTFLRGKIITKEIVVKSKLVNFVVDE
ncbi:leucine--tRNA ligase [Candidatus Peregrinibacteria bacterium]|nr:leucine--tRNA ligase [Candidatus Peregrinibacteria bacterium]